MTHASHNGMRFLGGARCRGARCRAALSLVEVLITVSLLGILAAAVLTSWEPGLNDQLTTVAQVVATDVAYTRSLAVNYDSSYTLTFDPAANRYVLTHSGSNPALDDLPASPYRQSDDSSTQQTTDLALLPAGSGTVELAVVYRVGSSMDEVSSVEFGSFGNTTRPETTVIWLAIGEGTARRYLSVEIDPVTGLTTVTEVQTVSPAPGEASTEELL